jgi:hypothetical protein
MDNGHGHEPVWDLVIGFFGGGLWHTRKQEEALETAEIALDSDWASSDSAGNGSRQEIFWSARTGLGFIPEKMWGWERIIPFLRESMGSSNMSRKEKIENR